MTARWSRQVGGNVRVVVDEAGCIVIEQEWLHPSPSDRVRHTTTHRFTVTNVTALVDALHDAADQVEDSGDQDSSR